jgi:beta-phosphoglucomutase
MPIFQGAIFDVDGVLVDSPHQTAWRDSLRELMESDWSDIRGRTTWSPEAFTSRVYEQYVSGKPRMSGARAALDYFHVPDADQRVGEYAQRKQDMVVRLIEAGDFTAYPDALRFVIAVKDAGLLIADASSSKNAMMLLSKISLDTFAQQQGITSPTLRPGLSLLDYFDADLSGRDFAHGKPDPEIFLTAARELGVEPDHAVVLEPRPAAWPRSGSHEPTIRSCSPRPGPTSWSLRSTTSIWPPSPQGDWPSGRPRHEMTSMSWAAPGRTGWRAFTGRPDRTG